MYLVMGFNSESLEAFSNAVKKNRQNPIRRLMRRGRLLPCTRAPHRASPFSFILFFIFIFFFLFLPVFFFFLFSFSILLSFFFYVLFSLLFSLGLIFIEKVQNFKFCSCFQKIFMSFKNLFTIYFFGL
jgi:hypothetical protein